MGVWRVRHAQRNVNQAYIPQEHNVAPPAFNPYLPDPDFTPWVPLLDTTRAHPPYTPSATLTYRTYPTGEVRLPTYEEAMQYGH